MSLPIANFLDLLACPKCRAQLRPEGELLVCAACGQKFESRSGVFDFVPPKHAERFVVAQKAEEKHHEESWTNLRFNYLPGVKSREDYGDWLESFYRIGLCVFGLATGYFREKTVVEIGSGPFGMLACLPHARGLAIDPLMQSFASYMRPYWGEQPARIAALGEQMPACSGMFDAAIAINTLDHTLDPRKILDETYRVLKPGSIFLISNNVKSRPGKWIGSVGERLGISRLTEVFHPHAFTKEGLIDECRSAGFEIVGDFFGKTTEPEPLRKQWSRKHAVRMWIENERMLWILAQKPNQKQT